MSTFSQAMPPIKENGRLLLLYSADTYPTTATGSVVTLLFGHPSTVPNPVTRVLIMMSVLLSSTRLQERTTRVATLMMMDMERVVY